MASRICIIDHYYHRMYIEDLTDEVLEPYGGDEQKYIDDNYTFEGDYSWDYIISSVYIGSNGDTYDLDECIDALKEEDNNLN